MATTKNDKTTPVGYDAFYERMRARTAPAWRPDAGQTIACQVINLRMGGEPVEAGGYGYYPIVTVEELAADGGKTGEVYALHVYHQIFRENLKDLEIKLGSRLIVNYMGIQKKNTPNAKGEFEEYHMYYAEDLDKVMSSAAVAEDFTL